MSNLMHMADILAKFGVNRDFYFSSFIGNKEDERPMAIKPTKCYLTIKQTDFLTFYTLWNSTSKNCMLTIKHHRSDVGELYSVSDNKATLEEEYKLKLDIWMYARREYMLSQARKKIDSKIDNFINYATGKQKAKKL